MEVRDERNLGVFIVEKSTAAEIMQGLGPYHWTVYSYLLTIIDKHTDQGSRAIKTIAKATGISENKARKCLRELEARGYILIEPRKDGERDMAPLYHILGRVHDVQGRVHDVGSTHKGTKYPTEQGAPHAPSPNNVADIQNASSRMHRGYGAEGSHRG